MIGHYFMLSNCCSVISIFNYISFLINEFSLQDSLEVWEVPWEQEDLGLELGQGLDLELVEGFLEEVGWQLVVGLDQDSGQEGHLVLALEQEV